MTTQQFSIVKRDNGREPAKFIGYLQLPFKFTTKFYLLLSETVRFVCVFQNYYQVGRVHISHLH